MNRIFIYIINIIKLTIYVNKFKSTQGLPPDYSVGFTFINGRLHHAVAIPVLNNWGVVNHSALYGHGVIVLPWSHKTTAEHLRSGL